MIRLCTAVPQNMTLSEATLDGMAEIIGQPLAKAIEAKRIFMIDYKIMDGVRTKQGFHLPAPIALFYVTGRGNLLPVAIQLEQQPGEKNPVFLPSDADYAWVQAKSWFNVADANYHEANVHLGFTHLKMGSICVTSHRQLHKQHPLFKLLMPHFIYLLGINDNVLPILLEKGAYADKAMSSGRLGMIDLINRRNEEWRLDVDGDLVADLKNRGLSEDGSMIPRYFYATDAKRVYDVIRKYVTNYVRLYYKSDDDVINDYELQKWRAEMVAPVSEGGESSGAGVKGVPGEGDKFTKVEHVIDTIVPIIFTCSVGHAAANFRQYEAYAFPLNYPTSLRGMPPTTTEGGSEAELMDTMPTKEETFDIMTIFDVLSYHGMNKLGKFEVEYVTDPDAVQIVEQFRADLRKAQKEFEQEYHNRVSVYDELNPDYIPNSISI